MSSQPIRVLIVDDEESLRLPLTDWLKREYGYAVAAAGNGRETLDILAVEAPFDVVLLDYLLPAPYNGITLMEEIKRRSVDTSVAFIIFTGWGLDPQVGVQALRAGAYRYLAKPFDREELAILIQSIVEMRHTREKLEATSREKAWLESLLEVSRSVNSTLELDRVLELILDEMRRVVLYDSASIQRITPEGLQIVACRGLAQPERSLGRVFPPSDAYPNYRVWHSRQPHIEADMQLIYQSANVRGWLGVPLIYRDEAIGVITLDSQTPGFYSDKEARLATVFANQAVIAMENARLFSETQRRLDDLDKVHRASQVIASYLDVHQVLAEVVALAGEVAGSDNASVALVDELGQLVKSVETITTAFQHIPPLHERARPNGKTYQVLRTGEPFIAHHVDPTGDHSSYLLQAGVASYAGLPLRAKQKVVGVLFVHSFVPHAFSKERIALLTTFANQAAVAIENAYLYKREFKRAEMLRALLEVEQEVTRNITTHSKILLDKIARTACQVTGADGAVIYPYLAESGKYDLANLGAFGLRGELTYQEKQRLTGGEGISSWVLRERRVIIYDAAQEDPRLLQHKFIKREGIQAFVGIRLDATEPVGILFVNYRQPHTWPDDELSLIDIFAGQAAVAILNARLFGRTSEKLEQTVAELRTVGEINQRISSTLDLDEVLPLILSKAMELVGVQNVALQLIDDETGELVVRLCEGPLLAPMAQARLKLGEGISGKAAQEKRSMVVPDVTQPPWGQRYRAFRSQIRSKLAVPLLIDEQCIGVLNFEHTEPSYFSEDKREIIEGLAAQAAIAIRNAKQYEDLMEAKEQLIATETVAWMGMIGSSWAHSAAQKTSSIRNYLAVLAGYLPDDERPRQLLAKADRVAAAIQDIPITRELPTGAGMGIVAPLLIDQALTDEVSKYVRSRPNLTLDFHLHCSGVKVAIDRGWLGVAMEKLVNNALKAMPEGGRLQILSTLTGKQVKIELVDTGRGIPAAYLAYFLKQRVPKENAENGTGMGALLARHIFRKYGGNLELLWSEPDRGTALCITLPVAEEMIDKTQ